MISGTDFPSSITLPLDGEGEGGGERVAQGYGEMLLTGPPGSLILPPPGGKENK